MLKLLALRRTREYADPISSSVGNCRSGCSAAIWSNIDVIAWGVMGISRERINRKSAASCLLVPMIKGTGSDRPSCTRLPG
jgi:hypothetical protein